MNQRAFYSAQGGAIPEFFSFGNTEVRESEFFGNSVFPNFPGTGFSGIRYSRSVLPNFRYSRAHKKPEKNPTKIYFFHKSMEIPMHFRDSRAFLGFLCIFRIPVHFHITTNSNFECNNINQIHSQL